MGRTARNGAVAQCPDGLAGRTFLLGVGAQKCGTSWLYSHFAAHPEARFPTTKELHIFDVAFRPRLYGHLAGMTAGSLRRLEDQTARNPLRRWRRRYRLAELRAITAAQRDPGRYAEIFANTAGAPLTGDITPSYAALNAKTFVHIRRILMDAGATPRVVFLMRDPVDRAYSAARMSARETDGYNAENVHALLRASLAAPRKLLRGRYDRTIQALEEAFAPEELFFGFYEHLFRVETVVRLSAFLGVAPQPANLDQRVNATTPLGPLPGDVSREARAVFDPVYRFCSDRFGADLPDSWAI